MHYLLIISSVVIASITVGVETKIDKSLIDSSGLTKSSLLGWQLLYILPVAVLTNDFFLSNFWIRTFASKTDKDLWVGVSIAAIVTLVILTLVGATGLIATWSGAFDPNNPDQDGSIAFFYLLEELPAWVSLTPRLSYCSSIREWEVLYKILSAGRHLTFAPESLRSLIRR